MMERSDNIRRRGGSMRAPGGVYEVADSSAGVVVVRSREGEGGHMTEAFDSGKQNNIVVTAATHL